MMLLINERNARMLYRSLLTIDLTQATPTELSVFRILRASGSGPGNILLAPTAVIPFLRYMFSTIRGGISGQFAVLYE